MKKILFAAAAMAAALFASCDKDDETINSVIPEAADSARIAITLIGAGDTETRAFFDTTAKAEAWESSLSILSVFAFDNGGTLIVRRDFTSAELASKSATFALPKSTAGTECSFYAVANYDASSAKTLTALTALVENSSATYNGTFAEVSTAAKRSGGFVMSGSVTKTVGNASTTDDRSEVTYSIELTGKTAGEILRNGYYRIAANITGLVGQDCAVSVTVADWETPITQNVELGA